MNSSEDRLIERLAGELRPVRALGPPSARVAGWLGVVLLAGLVLSAFADLSAVRHRMESLPDLRWATLGAVLTAACAGFAAFQASVPGRSGAWLLLPLPSAGLWLGASGWGCLRGWSLAGAPPATAQDSMHCALFILGASVPLSAALILLLRRSAPLQPGRVAALGGLAAAAAAASLLTLFHAEDASVIDVAVHAAAVAAVVAANEAWSGRLLRSGPTSP